MLLNVALQLGVINDGSSWPLYYGKRRISTFDRQFKSLTCCPTRPRHRGLPPKLVPPKHLFITSFPKRKTPKKTKSNIKTYSPKHWLNRETSLKRRKTLKGKNSWAQALKKESSPFWKVHRPSLIKLKCAFIKVRSSPVFFYSSQSRSWSRGSWSSRPAVAVFRQAGAADLPRKVFIFWCTAPNPPPGGAITGSAVATWWRRDAMRRRNMFTQEKWRLSAEKAPDMTYQKCVHEAVLQVINNV